MAVYDPVDDRLIVGFGAEPDALRRDVWSLPLGTNGTAVLGAGWATVKATRRPQSGRH